MNIENFESFIDNKILSRGRDYFKNDCVLSVEETGHNEYKAEVEGTELYSVDIELDDEGNIIDTVCDCPYDMGEYCKHQVAVFFTLRDMKRDITREESYPKPQPSITVSKPAARKAGKTSDICETLAARTKEELIEFLVSVADEYEEIRQRLELDFFSGNDEEEIKQSVKLIRAYIRRNSDRHGFVDYRNVFEATEGARLVLDKARSVLEKKKTMQAVNLALCVIHELMELLQSADDSDGFIGGEIEEALALIGEIAQTGGLASSDRESIFRKLAKEAADRRYEDWTDWKLNFLERCSELADTPVLRDACEKLLTLMVKNMDEGSWSDSYFVEHVKLIRYNMIKKHDGPERAREFIENNLKYSGFREMAIETAIRVKDYDTVERLAIDGEKMDHDKRGLVKKWMEYRYNAYRLTKNLDKLRAVAIEFILDGSFEYYMELKRTYNKNDWLTIYPLIISRLEDSKKVYYNSNVYTEILIEEAEKQKLYEYVENRPSEIEGYYKHLLPEFKEEVCALFLQHIEQTAARSSDRKAYQRVCAIIRNLKKAGGKEQVAQIKQKLLMKYPNKPAFKDELSRV